MDKKDFEDYIHSKQWKVLKGKVLKRDKHSCQYCGSKRKLIVHHLTYNRLFNENIEDLITICESCHIKFHKKNKINVPEFVRRNYYEMKRKRFNCLTWQEVFSLISNVKKENTKFYIKLAFLLCLKAGEIANIKKEDVNFKRGIIKIKNRFVPIIDPISNQLNSFLNDKFKKVGVRAIEMKIEKLSKGVLKRKITLNSLRHSGAIFYYENGMPIEVLSKFLGHKSPQVTAEMYSMKVSYMKIIKEMWS